MIRSTGVTVRGIRCPIIKEGDDLAKITVDSVLDACKNEEFDLRTKDVIALTESIVARAQGNYATIYQIRDDIKRKFPEGEVGVIFPILSRNRFSILLKAIALGVKKIYLMLSYPTDEVGNALISLDDVDEKGINPYSDVLTLERYRELFGYKKHEFTGVDYVAYYKELIEETGCEVEIIFANQAKTILNYTPYVLACDIHTRQRTKRILTKNGAKRVLGLDDILTESVNGSGYNKDYGLLGSNKADEERVKLFPRESEGLVLKIQKEIYKRTNTHVEVMVYGDGAFKDPKGHIWELADPVVSPFHTDGLNGVPNELKLKYLADAKYKDLKGEALKDAIKHEIETKDANLKGTMATQGTTPRQIPDLLGSLCDLASGSGDKGTPVVLVQGYFDNYVND